jgi:ribosomal protein S18 acetylase RimI-like enzyme
MQPDQVTIREATPEDFQAVLELWPRSAYGASPTDDDDAVAALLGRDPGALLVALDGDRIIGTIIVGWDGWRGSLYRLAVLDAYRRRGVGTMLVGEAELRLQALGARRIGALVEIDNDRGRAFWAAQEYAVADSQTRYVKDL